MGGSSDDDKEHTCANNSQLSTVSEMTLVDEVCVRESELTSVHNLPVLQVDPMQDETLTSQTIEIETHTVQPTESKTESNTTKPETHTTKSETHIMKPETYLLKSEMHTTCRTTNPETYATKSEMHTTCRTTNPETYATKTHVSTGSTKKSPVTSVCKDNTSISNKRSHSKGARKLCEDELGTHIKLPAQNKHVTDINLQDQGTSQEPQVTRKEPYSKSQRTPKELENTSQIPLTTREEDDSKAMLRESKPQPMTVRDTSLSSEAVIYNVPRQHRVTLEVENEIVFYETVMSKDVVQDHRESILQVNILHFYSFIISKISLIRKLSVILSFIL